MKKDDVLIVKIEDISSEGLGVGHVEVNAEAEVDADAGKNDGVDAGAGADRNAGACRSGAMAAGSGADTGVGACENGGVNAEANVGSGGSAGAKTGNGTTGFALFVKDTVIGDVAEVKIVKMKKHYGYARLQRILTASPDRIEALCAQARRCGGCQIQEMSYEAQLVFKERKVRGNLQRIGGFTEIPMEPILGMEQPFRYRNKAQYPVGRDRDGHLIAGFYAGRTHTVINCRDCLLGAEVNQTILDIILGHMEACGIEPYDETTGKGLVRHIMIRVGRKALSYSCARQAKKTRDAAVGAQTGGTQSGAEHRVDAKNAEYQDKSEWAECADAKGAGAGTEAVVWKPPIETEGTAESGSDEIMVCIVINGTSLPQSDRIVKALRGIPGMTSITLNINRERTNVIMGQQLKLLWGKEYIEDTLGGVRFRISPLSFYQVNPRQTEKLYGKALEYAGLTGNETVWDLYCGIGTISLFLARRARAVYGVEIVPDAIRDARQNAQLNGITNAEFIVGKAEEVLPQKYQNEGIQADVIVVDPPRKGCEQSVLDTMLKIRPSRIVYVSCDPATLARDLKYLHEGGYELKKACPVDMFGNSVHVETVVALSQRKPDDYIEVDLYLDELDATSAELKATYEEIKDYVLKEFGIKVSSLYISQIKRKCGLEVGPSYNHAKTDNARVPQCPPEKEEAIRAALKHFAMIKE